MVPRQKMATCWRQVAAQVMHPMTPKVIVSQQGGKVNNNMQTAALYYAANLGWPVIPLHSVRGGRCTCGSPSCTSPGKHPLTRHGVKDATTDPATVRDWWRRWPSANIGIATGKVSGFFVLDIDGQDGEETLATWQLEHGRLPDTLTSHTGSGGRHILFKTPGFPIQNKVRIGPGVDIRGDGGYIVAPPSIHVSGRRYAWKPTSKPGKAQLSSPPSWLLGMLRRETATAATPATDWRRLVSDGVTEGERNNTLARLVGHLLRRRVDPYVALELALCWNATRCRPPLPEAEVLRTVDSIARAEARRRGVLVSA